MHADPVAQSVVIAADRLPVEKPQAACPNERDSRQAEQSADRPSAAESSRHAEVLQNPMSAVYDQIAGPQPATTPCAQPRVGLQRATAATRPASTKSTSSQFVHFAARRVLVVHDIIDRRENLREVGARERHGLNAAEVERAVRPDEIKRWFGKPRRLLDACRCRSASR